MRLIDADVLLDKTIRKNSVWKGITNSEGKNLEEIVSELPSVNPQEPKIGHWVKSGVFDNLYTCSECGGNGYDTFKHCPHCGARMSESLYYAKHIGSTIANGISEGITTSQQIDDMTIDEAIYCLESYQPDAPDNMCQKCRHYHSVKIDNKVYTCKSNIARAMAIEALISIKDEGQYEEISEHNMKMWEDIFKAESESRE